MSVAIFDYQKVSWTEVFTTVNPRISNLCWACSCEKIHMIHKGEKNTWGDYFPYKKHRKNKLSQSDRVNVPWWMMVWVKLEKHQPRDWRLKFPCYQFPKSSWKALTCCEKHIQKIQLKLSIWIIHITRSNKDSVSASFKTMNLSGVSPNLRKTTSGCSANRWLFGHSNCWKMACRV